MLGWPGHELQWGHDAGTRRDDVARMYRDDGAAGAPLLRRYGVRYVVVGPIERTDPATPAWQVGRARRAVIEDLRLDRLAHAEWNKFSPTRRGGGYGRAMIRSGDGHGGGACAARDGRGRPARALCPGEVFGVAGLPLPPGRHPRGARAASMHDEPGYRSEASADGRDVAFISAADMLDLGAHPNTVNVFRKDRVTGDVALASRADGVAGAVARVRPAGSPRISAIGTAHLLAHRGGARSGRHRHGDDVYVRDVGRDDDAARQSRNGRRCRATTSRAMAPTSRSPPRPRSRA